MEQCPACDWDRKKPLNGFFSLPILSLTRFNHCFFQSEIGPFTVLPSRYLAGALNLKGFGCVLHLLPRTWSSFPQYSTSNSISFDIKFIAIVLVNSVCFQHFCKWDFCWLGSRHVCYLWLSMLLNHCLWICECMDKVEWVSFHWFVTDSVKVLQLALSTRPLTHLFLSAFDSQVTLQSDRNVFHKQQREGLSLCVICFINGIQFPPMRVFMVWSLILND